ncbi:MAG: glycosyltransferase [Alphaproteobacteria bacterium]|nr:glycosyltransferase [Alphaproteobacteria bacterium]
MKVSALVPIYNTDSAHLREMMDSILNQTFKDFELLILNNSPDRKELEELVKSYNDSRIKYFENERNMGISASRNQLMDLASGEYLAVCDHDDISVPDRFARQVEFLDENQDAGVVSGWLEHFGKTNFITSYHPEENAQIKAHLIATGCILAHPAAMIRKSVLINNNIRYEEKYSPCEDYMLWCRLMEFTEFHNIQDVLLRYRNFDGNTSNRQKKRMKNKDFEVRLFVENKYPALYSRRAEFLIFSRSFKLFGFIPILRYQRKRARAKLSLFYIIPLLRIKDRFSPYEKRLKTKGC